MMQFNPGEDPGSASSTGNPVTPVVLSIADYKTNFEDYESMLVKLESVHFVDAGNNFENGKNYKVYAGKDTTIVFTEFYNVDYIGTEIPQWADVTGVALEYFGKVEIAPRTSTDIEVIVTSLCLN